MINEKIEKENKDVQTPQDTLVYDASANLNLKKILVFYSSKG